MQTFLLEKNGSLWKELYTVHLEQTVSFAKQALSDPHVIQSKMLKTHVRSHRALALGFRIGAFHAV